MICAALPAAREEIAPLSPFSVLPYKPRGNKRLQGRRSAERGIYSTKISRHSDIAARILI